MEKQMTGIKEDINDKLGITDLPVMKEQLMTPGKLTTIQKRGLEKKMEDFHQALKNFDPTSAVTIIKEANSMYQSYKDLGKRDMAYDHILTSALHYMEDNYSKEWSDDR